MIIFHSPTEPRTRKTNDWTLRLPENTVLPPYCYVGRLTSIFPDNSCVHGTATLINTVHDEDVGLYAITNAANLYDCAFGGAAVKLTFHHALNQDNAGWITPIDVERSFYPPEFPAVCVPQTISRSLVKPAVLRAHDVFNYGLIKLAKAVPAYACPVLTVMPDEWIESQNVVLAGLYDQPTNYNTMHVIHTEVRQVKTTELRFRLPRHAPAKGTAVLSGVNRIIGIHTYSVACDAERQCARRVTSSMIYRIHSWQQNKHI